MENGLTGFILSIISFVWPEMLGVFLASYLLKGLHVTNEWERKPMKRWGKYFRTLEPGITWAEPFSSRIIETVEINDQVDNVYVELGMTTLPTMQTHDNVPVAFTVILTWRVIDAAKFVLEVQDGHHAVYSRCATLISEQVSRTELDQILHDRKELCLDTKSALQEATLAYGVQVIAIELKDVTITDSGIQEAIALKARATKEGEAELKRASMQSAIAEQLKAAAEVYDEEAWKLKGFETLLELCRSAENNTIMIPTDLVSSLAGVVGKK